MTRTWAQNSDTINGLWPHCQWTDEEIDLWHADLSGLDQDVLLEAIREVKRSRDSLYPQLAWVHAAYRTLITSKRTAERFARVTAPQPEGDRLQIDPAESRRLAEDFSGRIEEAGPGDVDAILADLAASVDRMDAVVAARLGWRAAAKRKAGNDASTIRMAASPTVEDGDDFEERRRKTLETLRAFSA